MITIKNISFSYNKNCHLIKNLNLEIKEGEIISIVGTSGSGKTTLFKLLTGMLKPSFGKIEFPFEVKPAYMTQNDLLLPWKTVLENVLLPFELGKKKYNREEIIHKAKKLIQEVGLEESISFYPDQLSGGMRQRVSLLRALITDSPILFLDEPFSSLDFITKETIYDLIKNLHAQRKMTILLVTHDFRDAFTLSDKIYHLQNGKIIKEWIIDSLRKNEHQFYHEIMMSIKHSFIKN